MCVISRSSWRSHQVPSGHSATSHTGSAQGISTRVVCITRVRLFRWPCKESAGRKAIASHECLTGIFHGFADEQACLAVWAGCTCLGGTHGCSSRHGHLGTLNPACYIVTPHARFPIVIRLDVFACRVACTSPDWPLGAFHQAQGLLASGACIGRPCLRWFGQRCLSGGSGLAVDIGKRRLAPFPVRRTTPKEAILTINSVHWLAASRARHDRTTLVRCA